MSILNSQLDFFEKSPSPEELMGHLSVLSNPQHIGTDVETVSRDNLLTKAFKKGGFDREGVVKLLIDEFQEQYTGWSRGERTKQRWRIINTILGQPTS